ncbi:hypothetical protein BDQ17DRAFT_1373442 [Cyathus striatus]|nr:hypothetical protein BDQ17DRAFT_1373442 [Cyathus striatus]
MDSPVKKSEKFNYLPDADVTFKSIDGVLFALHKRNLSIHTGGFPPADSSVESEPIQLTEKSEVLELLFQFVYPPGVPILVDVSFELLVELARAAEKYNVYIATPLCRVHMLYIVRSHSTLYSRKNITSADKYVLKSIVKCATDHSYMEILDQAAPLLAPEPLTSTIFLFPQHLQASWAIYREQWVDIQRDSYARLVSHRRQCDACKNRSDPLSLADLLIIEDSFLLMTLTCMKGINEWGGEVKRTIASKIRSFSTICNKPVLL